MAEIASVKTGHEGSMLSPSATEDGPWLESRIEPERRQLSFEDDFVSPGHDDAAVSKTDFVKMSDSNSYISSLEAKLAHIKGGKSCKSSRKLLDDLMAVKEGHMSRFMASDERSSSPMYTDVIDDNDALGLGAFDVIRARIYPERQALTAEELLALIASDFLNNAGQSDVADDLNATGAPITFHKTED